jgi:predicted aldo/keto reductase-like oxidoreductase
MEYRGLPRGGGNVSTIGVEAGSLYAAPLREIEDIIAYGMKRGVNLMDTDIYEDQASGPIARALRDGATGWPYKSIFARSTPTGPTRGQGILRRPKRVSRGN